MAMGECWINARVIMIINRTLIVNQLNQNDVVMAESSGINSIVYQHIKNGTHIPPTIKLIRSTDYRIPAGWWLRSIYKEIIYALPSRWVITEDCNLTNAFCKISYWSFNSRAQQAYALRNNGLATERKLKKHLFQENKYISMIILILKWFKLRTKKYQFVKSNLPQNQLVFFAKSNADVELWINLISNLASNKVVVVLDPMHNLNNFFLNNLKNKSITVINAGMESVSCLAPFPFFSKAESIILQRNLYNQLPLLSKYFATVKWLIKCKPIGVVFNAAENRPELHLMSDVLMRNNIKTHNTMNGIKAKTANNADVLFTKWFVWDEKMASILKDCEYPENNLEVAGHLAKDYALAHKFESTLDFDLEYYKAKKVISFFSINTEIDEKKDVYQLLNTLDDEYHILVREHPSYLGMDEKYYNHLTCNFELVDTTKSKQSLYDTLLVSDLVIVLGSTVALEATWFKVPVLTVEYKSDSILYCVDDVNIRHIQSREELIRALKKPLIKQIEKENEHRLETVAELYKTALLK